MPLREVVFEGRACVDRHVVLEDETSKRGPAVFLVNEREDETKLGPRGCIAVLPALAVVRCCQVRAVDDGRELHGCLREIEDPPSQAVFARARGRMRSRPAGRTAAFGQPKQR